MTLTFENKHEADCFVSHLLDAQEILDWTMEKAPTKKLKWAVKVTFKEIK